MNDTLKQYIAAHGCTLLAYSEESGMMLIGTMEHMGFCATEMVASLTSFRNFIGYQTMVKITRKIFIQAVGRPPIQDELERCNCPKAGEDDHDFCGWNYTKNLPCFMARGSEKDRIPTSKLQQGLNQIRRLNGRLLSLWLPKPTIKHNLPIVAPLLAGIISLQWRLIPLQVFTQIPIPIVNPYLHSGCKIILLRDASHIII